MISPESHETRRSIEKRNAHRFLRGFVVGWHWRNGEVLYAMLGENALAMDMLEKAVQHGYASRDWMENDGDFSAFRNDPRFRRILDSIFLRILNQQIDVDTRTLEVPIHID